MTHLVVRFLVIVFSVLLAAKLIPGVAVNGLTSALCVAIVLGVLNVTVRPILALLTLPITILTLGLFAFILNALMFWLASVVVPGFMVSGFLAALAGSLILSVISVLVNRLIHA